ncbi:hypothetical protein AF68_08860 [Streptococcus uberis B362]|nr:hypothetical protein AF68_08860 [Streptococcus uberis B362]
MELETTCFSARAFMTRVSFFGKMDRLNEARQKGLAF